MAACRFPLRRLRHEPKDDPPTNLVLCPSVRQKNCIELRGPREASTCAAILSLGSLLAWSGNATLDRHLSKSRHAYYCTSHGAGRGMVYFALLRPHRKHLKSTASCV